MYKDAAVFSGRPLLLSALLLPKTIYFYIVAVAADVLSVVIHSWFPASFFKYHFLSIDQK